MKFKITYALAREENNENGGKAESRNMESMTEEELREQADKAGLNVNPSMSKQDIIRALKNKYREMREI